MRVLLSLGEGTLARALSAGLSAHVEITSVGKIHPESAKATLSAGFDAIVVSGTPDDGAERPTDPSAVLDCTTRGLFDLLSSAAEAGVGRCVYLSSLRLMADYPVHFAVTEGWQVLPPLDDPALLGCYLGEMIAREFARERHFEVFALRLGYPLLVGVHPDQDGLHGEAAICTDEVVAVVTAALTAEVTNEYTVVHAQSPLPKARYLMSRAAELLGFPEGSTA